MVTLDEAREMLDELVAELPEAIFARLNGGVLLLPDVKLSSDAVANDLFTLGEYENSSAMGRAVRIYYGSILRAHGDMPPERFREKLRAVLHHELTHTWIDGRRSTVWRMTKRLSCPGKTRR
jgi:hypothetical protein